MDVQIINSKIKDEELFQVINKVELTNFIKGHCLDLLNENKKEILSLENYPINKRKIIKSNKVKFKELIDETLRHCNDRRRKIELFIKERFFYKLYFLIILSTLSRSSIAHQLSSFQGVVHLIFTRS